MLTSKMNSLLGVIAAILKTVFPLVCVWHFTKKKSRYAYLFVPSPKWEQWAILRFKLEGAFLSERVWSVETRVWLLEKERRELVKDIKTFKEFDVLLKHPFSGTFVSDFIVPALMVYTPQYEKLLALEKKLDDTDMEVVLNSVPKAFNSLNVANFSADFSCCGKKIRLLVVKQPHVFCTAVMQHVMKTPPQYLSQDQQELFAFCADVSIRHNVIVTKEICYMMVFFSQEYKQLRNHIFDTGIYFCDYFVLLFPQLVKYLNFGVNLYDEPTDGEEKNAVEARLWLRHGVKYLDYEQIWLCMAECYHILKNKLSNEAFIELTALMLARPIAKYECVKLLPFVPEVLREKTQRMIVQFQSGSNLEALFPFTGWKREQAEAALKKMISANSLAVDRLNELSQDLQKLAIKQLEIVSQLTVIDKFYSTYRSTQSPEFGAACDKIANLKLDPAAQIALIKGEHAACFLINQEVVQKYITKETLSDEALIYMFGLLDYSSIIDFYVQKWGISKKAYLALLTSSYKDKAPFMKAFIHSADEEASA